MTATQKATKALHDAGQSIWLDNITRKLLDDGGLAGYIRDLSVTGRPTISPLVPSARRMGSARPRWRKACEVNSRPRGVRWMKPFWIMNGSMISSIASRGSDSAAAIVSIPTGPPP